ncbi:MAG: hypothetical protein Q9207_004061 [Kuettlingeria erythrocarpa]
MPSDESAFRHLTIAWAARVSFPQLGARLKAFVQTRASITTFRLAVKNASSKPFRNLPEELISMIAGTVRDLVFEQKMKKWINIHKCLTNDCKPLSHVTDDEIVKMNDSSGFNLSQEELEDAFDDEIFEAHRINVETYYAKLAHLETSSKFAKCVQIFTRDFGIRPYFLIRKTYNDSDVEYEDFDVDVKAYLIIPITQAPILSSPGLEVATYAVNTTMDPSSVAGLTNEQCQRFQTVAAMLSLHAYDADEDESMYGEAVQIPTPTPCVCGSFCGDWYSEEDSERCPHVDIGIGSSKAAKAESDSNAAEEQPAEPSLVLSGTQRPPNPKPFKAKQLQPQLMILGCGELLAESGW